MLGTDVSLALNAFSARFPRVSIELVRLRWWSQARALLDGSVDVGFVRPPLVADGVDLLALYAEHLAAVLPIDHPRARDAKVDLAALTDDPVLEYAEAAEAWSAVWNADPRPTAPGPAMAPPSTTWRSCWATSAADAESPSCRVPSRPRSPGPTSRTSPSPTHHRARCPSPGTAHAPRTS
ncbi:LysR substrate-binding domain-containing protein [Streptomyces sp. MS1.AVA.1]|uniref:LysR substrate-binding domain-containing protein n=1 Tax=Streptomyces machairae TaxID=3134109 RepID=A0ABU8UVF6_9ACTN